MAVESKQEKARRLAGGSDKGVARKLDPIHKAILYISAGVLTLGKLVYSIGILNVQALDDSGKQCFYVPSVFDSVFNDIMSGAALLFVVSLYTAVNYFERK